VSLSGPSRSELTRMLARFGYGWSVQTGKLVITRDDNKVEGRAILVDKDNWLIGTPEWSSAVNSKKPPEAKFEAQLYPEIDPAKWIRLSSRSVTATLRAIKVKHVGETEGDPWTTSVDAVSV
jgi:hypothetical protein